MRTPTTLSLLIALGTAAGSLDAQTGRMLQRAGQVAVHSVPGDVRRAPGTWADIPAMRGAITLPKGGTLVATLTMETAIVYRGSGSCDVLVRMVVDDRLVAGTDIRFAAGQSGYRTVGRDFIGGQLSAGQHRVRFQWLARPGAAAGLARQRTLVLRFASSDAPDLKLVARQNGSVGSAGANGWTNFPDLKTSIELQWETDLIIRYSGDAFSTADGNQVWVRALVDNSQVADLYVTRSRTGGSQAFVFPKTRVPSGRHTVQLQWSSSAGGTIYRPLMVVEGYRTGGGRSAAVFASLAEGGPYKRTSNVFAPLPGIGYAAIRTYSRGDLEVRVSLDTEIKGSSKMLLQCVIDGSPIGNPIEVSEWLADTIRGVNTYTANWVARNLDPGVHAVRVDWAAASGAVYVADRSVVVTSVQGQCPLLVTALESSRPANYKYGGLYASSVVELENGKRVFRPYVGDMFWRARPGVADWFHENSDGGLYVVEAGIVGPNLKQYDEQTYRSLPGPFTKMKIEALQKADAAFDYSYYDRNGDKKVTTDELYGLVVMYQDTNFGEVRNDVPSVATSDGVTLDFGGGLATVYTPDFKQRWEIGVADHELSHLLIGAGDMREDNDPSAPGPFSIMDQHGWNGHLDPLHKWKAGKFDEPEIVAKDGYVTLAPIGDEARFLMLRDVRSHSGEYFLVENRGGKSYNASLPAKGLALWHCDQNRLPNWRTAVEIEPAGGLARKFAHHTYLFSGTDPGFAASKDVWDDSQHTNTRWHDGARSGIGLWGIERVGSDNSIRVFVDVPGPGALAQWEERRHDIGAGGKFQTRLRIVNTHQGSATMTVNVRSSAQLSWTRQVFTLQPYEQRILTVAVTPTALSQTVTADVRGAGGGSSADVMQLAGTCRTITGIAPASLLNLTLGAFDLSLNAPGQVEAVTIGNRVIASRDANDWSDGYYELLSGGRVVRVHAPQGLPPGTYSFRVRFPLCTSNPAGGVLTRMTSRALVTTPVLTAGRVQSVWITKGTMASGTVGLLTLSASPNPSIVSGLVKLDLGNAFRELLILPALVVDPISNAVAWRFPIPAALSGQRLYYQAVLIDPRNVHDLLTTNRAQTDLR